MTHKPMVVILLCHNNSAVLIDKRCFICIMLTPLGHSLVSTLIVQDVRSKQVLIYCAIIANY